MPWIWLNEKEYPEYQHSFYNTLADCVNKDSSNYNYCVADFGKTFNFNKNISKINLRVSADSFFHLYINGALKGIGPAASGGDFLCRATAPKHYYNNYEFEYDSNSVEIFAKVRLLPEVLTDYSRGRGGFFLSGTVLFEDGTSEKIETDSEWTAFVDSAYSGYQSYDSTLVCEDGIDSSEEVDDIWQAEDAPIPMLSLNSVFNQTYRISCGEKTSFRVNLDRIYGVYPVFKSNGKCKIELKTSELVGQNEMTESIVFGQKQNEYMSFRMHSAGTALISVENTDSNDIDLEAAFIAPWYPIEAEGSFKTSNEGLNKVYDVCKHTLKICRQTLHLDSTKHQELLACTGDYNIESLMTMFCFGDMRLAEFDLMRTADWLTANGGVMFHTTYSLIWVQMLHDVYMITGRKEILHYCRNALNMLLDRFESYIGENGVIDSPPDFMFVDWTVIDGFSMHHPPKALGQTVLNAFYYKALTDAEKIYSYIGEHNKSDDIKSKAETFKTRFNKVFFDDDKKLYFDGLGAPYGGEKHYHPANVNKKYFSKYPNILAALYGLCDRELAVDILDRIIFDNSLQDIQPYFMHYLLCAVRKYGMFDKYGMKLLERWIPVAEECDKGLKEGWIAPEESYSFDHSHAWGGTPAYQMPMALTGLEILEPGMKKLKFTPNLYGLEYAEIDIPTQWGMIAFKAQKGKEAVITAPECIEIIRGDLIENS